MSKNEVIFLEGQLLHSQSEQCTNFQKASLFLDMYWYLLNYWFKLPQLIV